MDQYPSSSKSRTIDYPVVNEDMNEMEVRTLEERETVSGEARDIK